MNSKLGHKSSSLNQSDSSSGVMQQEFRCGLNLPPLLLVGCSFQRLFVREVFTEGHKQKLQRETAWTQNISFRCERCQNEKQHKLIVSGNTRVLCVCTCFCNHGHVNTFQTVWTLTEDEDSLRLVSAFNRNVYWFQYLLLWALIKYKCVLTSCRRRYVGLR